MSTTSISLGGMNAAMNALDRSAWGIARQPVQRPAQGDALTTPTPTPPTANVAAAAAGPTLEDDLVSQLQAKNAFLINLRVFQASDEMLGALIDVKA